MTFRYNKRTFGGNFNQIIQTDVPIYAKIVCDAIIQINSWINIIQVV